MAISSTLISSAISTQFLARKFTGRNATDLANAIGLGLFTYLMTPNLVSCSLVGTAGPVGNISSIVVAGLVPTSMSGFMTQKAAKKLRGRDAMGLFSAISTGICTSLTAMMLTGTAVGVALGSGVGSFTAVNAQALSQQIALQMRVRKLLGKNNVDLADAVAFGIVQQLKTSTKFTLLVTGAIAPVPPVGPVAVASIPSIFTKVV